jgi:hypothetical protein
MQISPSASLPSSGLPPLQTAAQNSQANLAPPGGGGPPPASNTKDAAQNEAIDKSNDLQVTLKVRQANQARDLEPAPAYAEIWKNGIKVAVVDTRGGVNSLNGLVPSAQGIPGNGGALLAARRVAEIAQSIGGEVHVGGQVMDNQTLGVRAKLALAYNI